MFQKVITILSTSDVNGLRAGQSRLLFMLSNVLSYDGCVILFNCVYDCKRLYSKRVSLLGDRQELYLLIELVVVDVATSVTTCAYLNAYSDYIRFQTRTIDDFPFSNFSLGARIPMLV